MAIRKSKNSPMVRRASQFKEHVLARAKKMESAMAKIKVVGAFARRMSVGKSPKKVAQVLAAAGEPAAAKSEPALPGPASAPAEAVGGAGGGAGAGAE